MHLFFTSCDAETGCGVGRLYGNLAGYPHLKYTEIIPMLKQLLYRIGRFFSIFGGYSSREDIERAQMARKSQRSTPAAEADQAKRGGSQPPDAKA